MRCMNALKDPPAVPNVEDWCDRTIAATLLRVSTSTVIRMVADGRLREYRVGTCALYWRAEVNRLAEARKQAGISRDE